MERFSRFWYYFKALKKGNLNFGKRSLFVSLHFFLCFSFFLSFFLLEKTLFISFFNMTGSRETLMHKSYLTVTMSFAHVVETSVTVTNNSPSQDYTHLEYHLDYL